MGQRRLKINNSLKYDQLVHGRSSASSLFYFKSHYVCLIHILCLSFQSSKFPRDTRLFGELVKNPAPIVYLYPCLLTCDFIVYFLTSGGGIYLTLSLEAVKSMQKTLASTIEMEYYFWNRITNIRSMSIWLISDPTQNALCL